MRFALVNPNWKFKGSAYFGCTSPHLPLEFGYARALLQSAHHEVLLVDAHLEDLSREQVRTAVSRFRPDFTVITTAPTYLFWRCPPPELLHPQETAMDLRPLCPVLVAVGPHCSSTPGAALRKLGADVVIMGEFEQVLAMLPGGLHYGWETVPSVCFHDNGITRIQGKPFTADMDLLPALEWTAETIERHGHQHHRFDAPALGPGAEMETSRGCVYHCSFCARENFRTAYRRRDIRLVLAELDGLIARGVEYVYFIDDIFIPDRHLLGELYDRGVKFGVQLRIDNWNASMLEQLGRAGCVSIEAGVESVSEEGRSLMNKSSAVSLDEMTRRLIIAKKYIPFVQANLIDTGRDDPEKTARWRKLLRSSGVWANDPVPAFPYPGSPLYTKMWGRADDNAWETAHAYYLETYGRFSEIQEQRPLPLPELEIAVSR